MEENILLKVETPALATSKGLRKEVLIKTEIIREEITPISLGVSKVKIIPRVVGKIPETEKDQIILRNDDYDYLGYTCVL
jgi:hypothetical protein